MQKARGSAYPSMALTDAVDKLRSVASELGAGQGNRMVVLKAMGYKGESGTAGRAIASLGYFNLLDKMPDSSYKVSKLGLEIIYPETGNNSAALKTAALSPALYAKLHERYTGMSIPPELKNTLIHTHGVNVNGADGAAKDFIATMTYAGLVGVDGLVASNKTADQNSDEAGATAHEQPSPPPYNDMQAMALPRTLPSGVVVIFPKSLDIHVSFGEFGQVLKALDKKAEDLTEESPDEEGPSQV